MAFEISRTTSLLSQILKTIGLCLKFWQACYSTRDRFTN